MEQEKLFSMPFAKVYPLLVNKALHKGRTRAEVEAAVCWLTGYDGQALARLLEEGADCRKFFGDAPAIGERTALVTGSVCGVRVESIHDPLLQRIRCLDKLVDELARGKPLEKVLRN